MRLRLPGRRLSALLGAIEREFDRTKDAPLVVEMHQAALMALAARRHVFDRVLCDRARARVRAEPGLIGRLPAMVARARRPLWIEGWLDRAEFGLVAAIDATAGADDSCNVHFAGWLREGRNGPAVFLPAVATIGATAPGEPARIRLWDTAGTRKLLRLYSDSPARRGDYERRAADAMTLATATAIGCLTAPAGAVLASAARRRLAAAGLFGRNDDDPSNEHDAIRETN